jgi:hypothetical protein
MKHTAFPIIAGLALLFTSCDRKPADTAGAPPPDDSVVLARKHFIPPVGTVGTKISSMRMVEVPMKMTVGSQTLEGTATQNQDGKETYEVLSETKVRRVIVSHESSGKMSINGNEQPTPDKPESLLGLPVILERSGDQWSASLENGETPTKEQQDRIDKMIEEAQRESDFQMYGDAPRKIGDKWNVDPAKLLNFGDAEDVAGDYTVEFTELKDFQGVRCAVLKGTFDFKGKTGAEADAMDMRIKGEVVSVRSLPDMVDLDVNMNGTVTFSGSPGQDMEIQIEGPITVTEKISLNKP